MMNDPRFVKDRHAESDFICCFIHTMLAHEINNLQEDVPFYQDTLFWLWADQSMLLLLNAACLAEKQHVPVFKVFGLTRPWIESTTFRTRGKHANHYTTQAVLGWKSRVMFIIDKYVSIVHIGWLLLYCSSLLKTNVQVKFDSLGGWLSHGQSCHSKGAWAPLWRLLKRKKVKGIVWGKFWT